jgi:hypothetical protein
MNNQTTADLSTDRNARVSVARADRRAARLGQLIDRTYNLARDLEIASGSYVEAGQFAVQDRLRNVARNIRNQIEILEQVRTSASGGRRL